MKTRTFEEIWKELKQLEGCPVYTLKRPTRNDIIKVESTGITRRSEKGKKNHQDISYFKKAWRSIKEEGCFKREKGWPFVLAYMACLREIEFTRIPYAIWITENIHDFGKQVEKK